MGMAVVKLGIGKLQLRKKGLLPEMQSLAEISHFPAKIITPAASFLVPSATKMTAVSVNLSPNLDDECDSTT